MELAIAAATVVAAMIIILVCMQNSHSFTAVTSSVGCQGDTCYIERKGSVVMPGDVVRGRDGKPYQPPASWYVYGGNSEPIVTFLRRSQAAYNKWSIDNYISLLDHPTGVPVLPM
jgi:hypothetical protein